MTKKKETKPKTKICQKCGRELPLSSFNYMVKEQGTVMSICKECPLYSEKYGGYCDPKLWINPRTGQVSDVEMVGWVKGCGCRLMAKTRNKNNHCVLNKW